LQNVKKENLRNQNMPLSRLDLKEVPNAGCKTGCNKQDRIESTENDLCKSVNSVIDNLPVRCVGQWSVQKIYLLNQYFGIFTTGMQKKWEVNYIEICSGPGRCISRESGTEFNGTALSIINHDAYKYLNKALFFDFNQIIVDTLNNRLINYKTENAKALIGDYYKPQEICDKILKEINSNSLNLVFIDPTDCSIPFNLIRHIKNAIPKVDLIINIATGSDYNRNIKDLILNQEKFKNLIKKYSRFLDSTSFFQNKEIKKLALEGNNSQLRVAFRNAYLENLKGLGYEHFSYHRILNLYDILFATENERGMDFWKKATRYKYDGQGTINF
jgi:three-Cys-motif partner protein